MRNFVIGLIIIAAILALSVKEASAQDTGIRDTVYIDSVVATSYNSTSVPIFIYNDAELAGIEVTLSYDSPDVMIDSFSFVGGKVAGFANKGYQQLTTNSIDIYCVPISSNLIPTGSGYLGSLFFSFVPGLSPQMVRVDTITLTIGDQYLSTGFSDINAHLYAPFIVPGNIDIRLGSCCLGDRGNVDNSPDDITDIADLVYLVEFMFASGPEPACNDEANIDGSVDNAVDISDMVYLVEYMFAAGPPPPSCP